MNEQITASDAEKFVRAYWALVANCDGSYRGYSRGTILIQQIRGQWLDFPSWLAAYQFTLEHQEKVRQIEREIKWMKSALSYQSYSCRESILARLEAIRDELRRGVKE